ncbi:MAG: chloride channel protein [Sphingomonadales bacterium]|nr:chloride channel protein [Sphingomonadales bacterium]
MAARLPLRLAFTRTRSVRRRLATVIGAVALSLVAIAFAAAGGWAQKLFLLAENRWPWLALLLTPATFAGVAWATRRWLPATAGSGIPQVMVAARYPRKPEMAPLVSLRTACGKLAGTLLMLLGGGSVGREGPTVQISAAIMATTHRWLRVPLTSGVIIAGGAAGIAAAFNTPLAGVAFAIEELASAFEQRVAVLVMGAVLIAGLVSLGLAGDYVYFGAMNQGLPLRTMLLAAPLAGVAGGLAGGLFARLLIAGRSLPRGPFAWLRNRPVLFAALCGLIVAITGIASDGLTWGTGYQETRTLLAGGDLPIGFGPARFIATTATALSGAPGGIFAPSLSTGAGLGQLLSTLFPAGHSGAIVLLGMIAYFTGVTRAPLTAIIIVMEMTADRTMILPLFAAALIADWISLQISPDKLYHALSRRFEPERLTAS